MKSLASDYYYLSLSGPLKFIIVPTQKNFKKISPIKFAIKKWVRTTHVAIRVLNQSLG